MLQAAPEMLQLALNKRQINAQCCEASGTGLSQVKRSELSKTTAADIPRDALSQVRSAQLASQQWVP